MSAYLVSYDLKKLGQNYECIRTKLQAYRKSWNMQGSVWIISSDQTAPQIRDDLVKCLDGNDNVFVAKLEVTAWTGFASQSDAWLKQTIEE